MYLYLTSLYLFFNHHTFNCMEHFYHLFFQNEYDMSPSFIEMHYGVGNGFPRVQIRYFNDKRNMGSHPFDCLLNECKLDFEIDALLLNIIYTKLNFFWLHIYTFNVQVIQEKMQFYVNNEFFMFAFYMLIKRSLLTVTIMQCKSVRPVSSIAVRTNQIFESYINKQLGTWDTVIAFLEDGRGIR